MWQPVNVKTSSIRGSSQAATECKVYVFILKTQEVRLSILDGENARLKGHDVFFVFEVYGLCLSREHESVVRSFHLVFKIDLQQTPNQIAPKIPLAVDTLLTREVRSESSAVLIPHLSEWTHLHWKVHPMQSALCVFGHTGCIC